MMSALLVRGYSTVDFFSQSERSPFCPLSNEWLCFGDVGWSWTWTRRCRMVSILSPAVSQHLMIDSVSEMSGGFG